MTSFTAETMRGFVGELAADLQARTDLVEQNRQDVAAMLQLAAKDRQNAETQRNRQSRRTAETRKRFVNRLKKNVTVLIGDFCNMRMEMASEIQAASNMFHNRNLKGTRTPSLAVAQKPRTNPAPAPAKSAPLVEQLVARHQQPPPAPARPAPKVEFSHPEVQAPVVKAVETRVFEPVVATPPVANAGTGEVAKQTP
jgi:hypothetical protein